MNEKRKRPIESLPGLQDDRLYTPEESARYLAIGRTKAYALLKGGELPSVKIGKARRASGLAIRQYIARLQSVATHQA